MNHRWILFIPVIAALCCATSAPAQDYQSIERNTFILQKLAGSVEGYAEALGGELIDYPRMRDDRPFALVTRATNGTHAIAWKSAPVVTTSDSNDISFVVHAGIVTRPNTQFGFVLVVNDTARVSFSTVDTISWEAGVAGGIRLAFYGALRDQHTDAFGFLQIRVPKRLVTPGEPVHFRAVGDSAGSRVWFMVFRDADVLTYLAERVASESACQISFNERAREYQGKLTAPTAWLNKKVAYSFAESPVTPLSLFVENDTAIASFTLPALKQSSFTLSCDGEKIIEVSGLFRDMGQRVLFPKKIVTLKSRSLPSGRWVLEHKSIYAPQVSPAFATLSAASRKSDTLHLVISTHQDIAWMDSPEQCVKDRDEKILSPALDLMKADPQYRFDLEDVLFLREFLERHPDRKGELQRVIASGRLGIGASYNQPYEDLSSGEMLVRQFYAGRKWLRKNFPGCDSRTYWNPDVPARSAQMPQIMSKAGVKYLFMSRFGRGLYRWTSPDSSSVLAMSPGHYADFAERVGRKGFPEMAGFIANFSREWSSEIPNGSATVPVVSMTDMSTPVRYGDLIDTWNGATSISLPQGASQPLSLPFIRYSTAEQFFNGVAAEKPVIPSLFGERPNIWLYIHGPTHHRAVSAKREADFYLPAAETFSTVEALLARSFARYPQKELTSAWESQLYPDHGWGGKNGDITDSTFRAKYEEARNTSKRIYSSAAAAIAARIQTSPGKGLPVVLFNSLSWRRTSPVHLSITAAPGEFRQGFVLYSASGRIIPSQASTITRYPDGSINSAEIVFVAENLPPVGYSTVYLRRSPRVSAPDTSSAVIASLENQYYVMSLAPGGVRQIFDIKLKKELLSTEKFLGGELLSMQSVGEDAGEWSEPQQPTMEGFDKLSNYNPGWRLIEHGNVRQVAELRQEINHVTVVQRIVLYSTVKQIDFETDLLKWDGTKYREFRLAFPLKLEAGRITYEIPFGAVEVGKDEMKGNAGERYVKEVSTIRPRSIQNWINASDNDIGVTFGSSVAVWDYHDPTDQPMTSPLLQPILLTSRKSCHGLGPWYLQEGDHAYRFSMTSHRPDWRNGRRFGVAANAPVMVAFNPRPSGPPTLPEEKSFFSVAADNIVLSTMKKCEDDDAVVLRFYEDAGMNGTAKVRFATPLQSVQNTNIIEEEGRPMPLKIDEISLKLPHHSIETYKVVPRFR